MEKVRKLTFYMSVFLNYYFLEARDYILKLSLLTPSLILRSLLITNCTLALYLLFIYVN